ncbi:MAG: HAMP domain-containing protein [Firmicutes bacterium]|nr:HAMP domain-containing protein [Bacillota bacterium]
MFKWLKSENLKRPWSLALILAMAFLALSLVPLLISGALGTIFSYLTQRNLAFAQQQLIGNHAANLVSRFIQEKFSALEATARLVNPANTSREEQKRILSHLLGPQPAFRQLLLLNSRKEQSVEISRRSHTVSIEIWDYIGEDLFMAVQRGNRYTGPVYVDKVTCEPMALIAVPALDVFGDYQGVLIADVNLKFMWELINSLKVGKTGRVYVVDRKGYLIAFEDITPVLRGANLSGLAIVKEFMRRPITASLSGPKVFKGINGNTVLGTYTSLQTPDWAVVTEMPVAEALRWVTGTVVSISLFILLIAGLAGWFSFYLARRLTGPLVNLMKTATRIAGGEMELQAAVEGPPEIASLAVAFNTMTARLRDTIGNLERRGRYLQSTVQKYVEYMSKVAQGDMDERLDLGLLEKEILAVDPSTANPLIVLGKQLNETTVSLQLMFQQIQETTDSLKEREAKLQVYSERLEKSNMELEQFAYIASHDLQEPLRKIQMFGAKLQENHSQALDEKALDYLQRMNNAAVRMEKLIRDLLHYSRVSANNQTFEPVDLNLIIKEALNDLEVTINESQAEIIVGQLPIVQGDPLQMLELFQNLIGNSIKYHQPNIAPKIRVQSEIIFESGQGFHKIEVIDNGIGFDNAYAEKIFGLFQRLHGRSEYQGTGIGLAICRKIVTTHGGVITASGKIGEGAVFTIKLPVNQGLGAG